MIPRGRRRHGGGPRGRGFPSHELQDALQAPGLGSGGLASDSTSATDCQVTLSGSLPCPSLSFHIWEEEGSQRGFQVSSVPYSRSSVKGVGVGPAFEETGSSL